MNNEYWKEIITLLRIVFFINFYSLIYVYTYKDLIFTIISFIFCRYYNPSFFIWRIYKYLNNFQIYNYKNRQKENL